MTVAEAIAAAGGRLDEGRDYAVVVTPAGRERDARIADLQSELAPGDIVELAEPPG
jgi:protein involved in polysaccharide export with SLBB domain